MKNKKTAIRILSMVNEMVKAKAPDDCMHESEWYAGKEAMIDVAVKQLKLMVSAEEEEW